MCHYLVTFAKEQGELLAVMPQVETPVSQWSEDMAPESPVAPCRMQQRKRDNITNMSAFHFTCRWSDPNSHLLVASQHVTVPSQIVILAEDAKAASIARRICLLSLLPRFTSNRSSTLFSSFFCLSCLPGAAPNTRRAAFTSDFAEMPCLLAGAEQGLSIS